MSLDSPHLADVDVTRAPRRPVYGRARCRLTPADAIGPPTSRSPPSPYLDLLTRAWKLRESVTAYDAMYVVPAEALDAPIVTCDTTLARTPGHRARIEVIA
jgi:hypothetical protein